MPQSPNINANALSFIGIITAIGLLWRSPKRVCPNYSCICLYLFTNFAIYGIFSVLLHHIFPYLHKTMPLIHKSMAQLLVLGIQIANVWNNPVQISLPKQSMLYH